MNSESSYVFVNGEFLPESEGKVSIFDRGFLFADAVYEVVAIINGNLVDENAHLMRLENSLAAIDIESPFSSKQLVEYIEQLAKLNKLTEGLVYIQISRGASARSFEYPEDVSPTAIMFCTPKSILNDHIAKTGIKIITVDDIRWKRRDIKTVDLLAACMCKQNALKSGIDDAWLLEDGFISEGTSSNAFILSNQNTIVTRQLGNEILPGITLRAVLHIAEEQGLAIEERAFTVKELIDAKEALCTNATSIVTPVVEVNGQLIGDGKPGQLSKL